MNKDRIKAIEIARSWLKNDRVYLDTETTGLGDDAEVVDIGIIGANGERLLDTLIRPTAPIPPGATKVHGITNEDVVDAPGYPEIAPNIATLLDGKLPIIYNRDYDARILDQSARANKIGPTPFNAVCAMELYAQFYGDWNGYHQSYRWQSQANAAKQLGIEIPADLHRAAADANLCRLIVEAMAATPLPGEGEESTAAQFISAFNSMSRKAHAIAKQKGFWQRPREDGVLIALMHSELSEALEASRHGDPPDDKIPDFNGIEAELADCIIRIMDMAAARRMRVSEALVAKMAYNIGRDHKHGKEF